MTLYRVGPKDMLFRNFGERLARIQNSVEDLSFGWVALALSQLYATRYLLYPAMPTKTPHPDGWNGWWDQSQYILSAQSFAKGLLAPELHWYPPTYALLAAPFTKIMATQPFYIPNLCLLLLSAWLFLRIFDQLLIPRIWGIGTFIVCVFVSNLVLEQFVIPWSTTLTMPILFALIVLYLIIIAGRMTFWLGFCFALFTVLLAFTRPTDILCLLPIYGHLNYLILKRSYNDRSPELVPGVIGYGVGAFVCIICALSLYLAIYGLSKPAYVTSSEKFGLDVRIIPFRFYQLFISPKSFFGEGEGIISRWPAVAVGLIATFYCLVFWKRYWALPACVLCYICIYLAYPDFLPTGIWRYHNIHYLKWTLPMMGLFTVVMIYDLRQRLTLMRSSVVLVPIASMLLIQYGAHDVEVLRKEQNADGSMFVELREPLPIRGARLRITTASFEEVYFGWKHHVVVDGKILNHIIDYRMIPVGQNIFAVFNRPMTASTMTFIFDTAANKIDIAPDLTPVIGRFSIRGLSR